VTLDQARAEVSVIAQQLRKTHGDKMNAVDFTAVPLQGFLTRNVRQGLWLLLGSVGLLLLIACANFSNLLLGQLLTRQREFTVRCALGASRWRITRQVLTENLLLTLPAAAFGALFAHFAVRLLLTMDNGTIPRLNTIAVDGRVLLFACALALLIAVILSFLPGIRMAASNLTTALKSGGRGQTAGAGGRLRSVLAVGQISLTIVLLAGAGLLIRSFLNVMRVEPGFETESAVAMTLNLPTTISVEEDEQIRQFYVQLLDRIEQMPGVRAVGGVNVLPLTGTGSTGTFLINNDPNQSGQAVYRIASRGYFSAMRIALLQGRFFETGDKVNTQHVAVVSRSLVQRYWPNENPIGKQVHFSFDVEKRPLEIVGVVADIRESLEAEVKPTVYAYSFHRPQWWQVARLAIVVRAQSDPKTLIPGLRETVNGLRKNTPMSFATLEQVFSTSLDTRRFTLVMFGAFGGMALLITVIGLYGMLAYSVAERTREMGIRMAVGAQRRDVLQLVIKQGLKLVVVGIFIGLGGAWALTRLMSTLLFGVTPTDSLTLVSVALTLILVALLACFIPARRATRVDPLVALREE
jgi:predicted permease